MEITKELQADIDAITAHRRAQARLAQTADKLEALEAQGIERIFDPVVVMWLMGEGLGQDKISINASDHGLIADALPEGMKSVAQSSPYRFFYDTIHLKSIESALCAKKLAWRIHYVEGRTCSK
jgi:hypothetical protein